MALSKSLSLLLVVALAQASPGWMPQSNSCEYVQHPGMPTTSPGVGPEPTLPKLPDQYSLKVEANIYQKQWTSEVEEHYDFPNQRASASYTFNGTTVWTFFDYSTGERYDVYPNGTCDTGDAIFNYYGFSKYKGKDQRPVMATINEVFGFGKNFNQTYKGTTNVRGIPVDHWTACQEWGMLGTKFQLDWYFSQADYVTASGHSQIPIRAVLNGHARKMDSSSADGMVANHTFQHVYEFLAFRSGPHLNEDVFEIPPGVVCKNMKKSNKEMPSMPDKFEMSMEVVVPNSRMKPRQQYLRYDYDHRLVEKWSRSTVPQGARAQMAEGEEYNFDEDSPLVTMSSSVLEDHHNGIVYHMDKVNLSCSVSKLNSMADSMTMSHGQNLLFLDTDGAKAMHYQGVTTIRGMKVDVWALERDGVTQQAYFLPPRTAKKDKGNDGNAQAASGGDQTQGGRGSGQGGQNWGGQGGQNWSGQGGRGNGQNWGGQGTGQGGRGNGQNWSGQGNGQGGRGNGQNWGQGQGRPQTGGASQDNKPKGAWAPGKGKVTNKNMYPYPVLVGMYLRNTTAATRPEDMPVLFRQALTQDALRWAMEAGIDTTEVMASGSMKEVHKKARQMLAAMDTSDQIYWGNQMERIMDSVVGEKMVHVYQYHPRHLDSSNFQVSFCYEAHQKTRVMLAIMAKFEDDVLHHYSTFSNSIRAAIASTTGLSALQISELVPTPMKIMGRDCTSVTFTLLGRPGGVESTRQATIEEAREKLKDAIDRGISFHVEYPEHSKSFMVEKKLYALDYDRQKMAELVGKLGATGSAEEQYGNEWDGGNGGDGGDSGYSSGVVAAIAIVCVVVGAAACFGVIFAIYKRRNPGQSFAPYKMT